MKNKILVELIVPEIEERFDIYLPINKKIGSIINLLQKSVVELSDGDYVPTNNTILYNGETGDNYDINKIVKETDIRNGTKLVLM